jgi:hypothetical protein
MDASLMQISSNLLQTPDVKTLDIQGASAWANRVIVGFLASRRKQVQHSELKLHHHLLSKVIGYIEV